MKQQNMSHTFKGYEKFCLTSQGRFRHTTSKTRQKIQLIFELMITVVPKKRAANSLPIENILTI